MLWPVLALFEEVGPFSRIVVFDGHVTKTVVHRSFHEFAVQTGFLGSGAKFNIFI